LRRQIAAADDEIDRLVYELYGLTEEEIKIVEGKGLHFGVRRLDAAFVCGGLTPHCDGLMSFPYESRCG